MPYKNKLDQKQYQKKHQQRRLNRIYLSIIDKNKTTEELVEFLMSIHGCKRSAILKRMSEEERNKLIPLIKQSLKKRIRNNQKIKFQNNQNFIQNILDNSVCDCGEKNTNKLEFHHTDPSKKTEVSIRQLCRHPLNYIKKEIQSCRVICRNCHTIIHNGQDISKIQRLVDSYKTVIPQKRDKRKSRLFLFLHKLEQKCEKCNHNNPICLVFHHIEHDDKTEKLSRLKSIPTINKELSKTICLCQNCHNEFHNLYGTRSNQTQLEEYLGKPIIPNLVNLFDYTEKFKNLISTYTPSPL